MPIRPTFRDIAAITQGIIQQQYAPDIPLSNLLLDSRRVTFATTSIFFAIKGQTHNGHRFITELYAKGVRRFVVSETVDTKTLPDADILLVNNAIDALQAIAAWWRDAFQIPVIGITGSNGKTIVKEWLHQLWHDRYYIVRSPKSYNSQIGVPLSVWQMDMQHELAIFEAGISRRGEMTPLSHIIRPTIGILTNIGAAHDKGFDSQLEKTIEKLCLFRTAQLLVYRADYTIINEAIQQLRQQDPSAYTFHTLAWTLASDQTASDKNDKQDSHAPTEIASEEKNAIPINIVRYATHTSISLTLPTARYLPLATHQAALHAVPHLLHSLHPTLATCHEPPLVFTVPFTDNAHIENAIHCILLSLYINVSLEDLIQGVKRLMPVAMRLEMKAGTNNCSIINDSYSADLHSLTIALDFMAQQQQHDQKTVILSDILESGQSRQTLYTQVAELLQQKGVSRFIGIGERISSCAAIFSHFNATFFPKTSDFLYANTSFSNETILVKGARTFSFEKIVALLEQKNHSTVLEINLDAIAHNFKIYRNLLHHSTKIMVMVKAFSYGSGTYEIANLLQYHKADYLAVAYTDEGVALRQAGIRLPIMILNPLPETFDALIRYDLEPEIYSISQSKRFLQYLQQLPDKNKKPYPVHLKLDTGMHRLGIETQHLEKIISLLCDLEQIRVVSILTHLSAADESEHDSFTLQQFQQFEAMCHEIEEAIGYKTIRHVLNSAGITRFLQMQADMVRLGLGIYGFDSSNLIQAELQQVSTLKTYISQIKNLAPNDTVGYGRRGELMQASRIATVSIGYADGLNRRLSNGVGAMSVHGQLVPIVGNICMDMTMIDVTNVPNVQEDDEVTVFGNEIPVQTLAKQLNTIPYEIITAISSRVKRVYYQSEN